MASERQERRRRGRTFNADLLHERLTRQETQLENYGAWLKNHAESTNSRFFAIQEEIKTLEEGVRKGFEGINHTLSGMGATTSAPLWKFGTILISLGAIAITVVSGFGTMVQSFNNERFNSIHQSQQWEDRHTDRYRLAKETELGDLKTRIATSETLVAASVSSLEKLDTVLQREMDLKNDNLRKEMLGRFGGIDKQIESINLRIGELAGRLFNLTVPERKE